MIVRRSTLLFLTLLCLAGVCPAQKLVTLADLSFFCPQGGERVAFPPKESLGGNTFENQAHDLPQRVIYQSRSK